MQTIHAHLRHPVLLNSIKYIPPIISLVSPRKMASFWAIAWTILLTNTDTHTHIYILYKLYIYTLRQSNVAMENPPFIDDAH
jgi:hypothetical protein